MVDIDTVYQKVLAFANKEQRGYITPQEFNLFASQAQLEIYEQYHYDVNHLELKDSLNASNSNVTDFTRQKLDVFLKTIGPTAVLSFNVSGNAIALPSYIYRISRVEVNGYMAEYLDNNNFKDAITATGLLKPNAFRPVFTERGKQLRVNNGSNITSGIGLQYYRLPATVSWGYFVLSDSTNNNQSKALYDPQPSKTTHFELHPSEEAELVYKILKFSGISMAKQDVLQAGQGMESMQVQQENK